jgi:DoxX-like family
MRKDIIAYWTSTAFLALVMTASGALALLHTPPYMKALAHLGYPAYFSNLLGVGKLVGVFVLLTPGLSKLKEWAYVAFGITVMSACYSHLASGDGLLALEPLVTFATLVVSYRYRPVSRAFDQAKPARTTPVTSPGVAH